MTAFEFNVHNKMTSSTAAESQTKVSSIFYSATVINAVVLKTKLLFNNNGFSRP